MHTDYVYVRQLRTSLCMSVPQVNNEPVDPALTQRYPYRHWAISEKKTYCASIPSPLLPSPPSPSPSLLRRVQADWHIRTTIAGTSDHATISRCAHARTHGCRNSHTSYLIPHTSTLIPNTHMQQELRSSPRYRPSPRTTPSPATRTQPQSRAGSSRSSSSAATWSGRMS